MTDDEKTAHKRAQIANWRDDHKEQYLAYQREYFRAHYIPRQRKRLTDEEKRSRRNRAAWLYRQKNYQKCLEREREAHRKHRDKIRKNPYVPAMSRRIPWYAENAAHARHLAKIAEERKMAATVSFATAIQSGLTVGRFSA